MKIERLIGIITTLQQNKKATTLFLARKFKVSQKTIRRDVEEICRVGIPVVATPGKDGGVSIIDEFLLDTTVFTEQELAAIFLGLKTLDSVSNSSRATRIANMTDDYMITAIYDSSVKCRLIEEYGPEAFSVMDDGRLLVKWGFSNSDEAVSWFLSFGDKVRVIEPLEMVEKMKTAAMAVVQKYFEQDI